jgi:hypothetical protein
MSDNKASHAVVVNGKIVFSGTFMQCWFRLQYILMFVAGSKNNSAGIQRLDTMNGNSKGVS